MRENEHDGFRHDLAKHLITLGGPEREEGVLSLRATPLTDHLITGLTTTLAGDLGKSARECLAEYLGSVDH